jgi:DNA-binding response OmpR family regulator
MIALNGLSRPGYMAGSLSPFRHLPQAGVSANDLQRWIPMRKKILVVDDEKVMRSLVTIAMQRNGYTVIDAGSSSQALEYLNRTTPDLIILDVLMPGMNGIELCRRIRSRAATMNTPIIMFSALGDNDAISDALAAGADRYLHKLNLFGDLVATVESTLANQGASRLHIQQQPALTKSAV